MSQALSMNLEVLGQKIFTCEADARFGLQHSDRAALPSLAGVLADVNEGWIKDVGRWAQPTSHEYVRAHVQRVRSIQRRVALNTRLPCGAPGAFDEGEVHADLSDFLLRDGIGSEEVVEQVLALLWHWHGPGRRCSPLRHTPSLHLQTLINNMLFHRIRLFMDLTGVPQTRIKLRR